MHYPSAHHKRRGSLKRKNHTSQRPTHFSGVALPLRILTAELLLQHSAHVRGAVGHHKQPNALRPQRCQRPNAAVVRWQRLVRLQKCLQQSFGHPGLQRGIRPTEAATKYVCELAEPKTESHVRRTFDRHAQQAMRRNRAVPSGLRCCAPTADDQPHTSESTALTDADTVQCLESNHEQPHRTQHTCLRMCGESNSARTNRMRDLSSCRLRRFCATSSAIVCTK